MFSLIFVVSLFVLGLYLLILRRYRLASGAWKKDDRNDARSSNAIVFCIIAWVIAGGFIIGSLFVSWTNQLNNFSVVKKTQKQIALFEERREKLIIVVKVELAKYPEYEKKIMGNIRPQFLLQFPNLKSNETITKTVEELVKLEDAVYKIRLELLAIQQEIFAREISPWVLYVPPYQKFFSEQNPIEK